MAATMLVNRYTKEGVESYAFFCILVHIVNSKRLKFNAVNGQSPENQCGQWLNTEKELVKVLTCSCSCDY